MTKPPQLPPFKTALGGAFNDLAPILQRFHGDDGTRHFAGRVRVEHGRGILPALAIRLGKFPPPSGDIDITILVTPTATGERWDRYFGPHHTGSDLRYDPVTKQVFERFGALSCALSLRPDTGGLQVSIGSAHLLGVPLPQVLTPHSISKEWQDDQGRMCFDVAAYLGADRLLIRYNGWLEATASTAP